MLKWKLFTWCVNDCEIGAKLVFDFHHDLSLPELVFSLQPGIFVLYVLLQACRQSSQKIEVSDVLEPLRALNRFHAFAETH